MTHVPLGSDPFCPPYAVGDDYTLPADRAPTTLLEE